MGLSMGLYWPNCLNFLSKWQKVSTPEKSKKNFAFFNFSWNFGFISGLLVGFSWAIFLGDEVGMIISWLISFLLIPVSLFLEKDEDLEGEEEKTMFQTEDPLSQLDIKEDLVINSQTPMIVYPILYSWLCIMFLATSKSILMFGYPILLKSFFPIDTPTYPTYLVQCGVQLAQLGGLTWINYMGIYKRKIASLIGVGMVSSVAFTIILFGNIWYISIITTIAGLFIGLIHGVGMKIMLEYGTAENTSKYSMINEVIIGISFGVTPIISGYVAEFQIYALHSFIIIFGIMALIFLIFLSRNLENKKQALVRKKSKFFKSFLERIS
jgi:MFS family permease